MEIKIQCACGTRFAFEVEPVNGQMPTIVACPRCGTDQTAQADRQIQQQTPVVTAGVPPPLPVASSLAAPILPSGRRGLRILNIPGYDGAPAVAAVRAAVPLDPSLAPVLPAIPIYDDAPVASGVHMDVTGADIEPPKTVPLHIGGTAAPSPPLPESFPPPPEPPPDEISPTSSSGGGLRVSRTKKAAAPAPPPVPVVEASAPVEESAPPRRNTPLAALNADKGSSPVGGLLNWLKHHGKGAIGGTVAVVLVGFKLLVKSKLLIKLVAVIFGVTVGSNSGDMDTDEWNFEYPNTTQVYVKAEDPKQVLDLCSNYWKHEGKELQVSEGEMGQLDQTHFAVTPAHQGYVAILGTLDWNTNFVDGLSKELSGKLGSTVLTFKESDFSGAHHFAVYQSGQRNFVHDYAQHIANNDMKEEYKVEGESWVQDNGYFKPGKKGFDEFNSGHINLISKKLGLHWWDFPVQSNGFYRLQE